MTAFHLFPLLPLELRQRIWQMSMEPREILANPKPLWKPAPGEEKWTLSIDSSRALTFEFRSLVSACASSESRSSILRFYTPISSSNSPSMPQTSSDDKNSSNGKIPAPMWINFDIDTFSCRGDDLYLLVGAPWISDIRRLALTVVARDDMDVALDFAQGYTGAICRYLVSLEHLSIGSFFVHSTAVQGRDDNGMPTVWQDAWIDILASWYNRCQPLADFDTRITRQGYPDAGELNRYNFMEFDRRRWKKSPGRVLPCPDSDSEDDFDTRYQPYTWDHNGPNCPAKGTKIPWRCCPCVKK